MQSNAKAPGHRSSQPYRWSVALGFPGRLHRQPNKPAWVLCSGPYGLAVIPLP
uniref:Uncharacterized protein n=1 Tax=Anopheles gambiae TaxID=7165 RepID=A0A903XYY4_ANOGA